MTVDPVAVTLVAGWVDGSATQAGARLAAVGPPATLLHAEELDAAATAGVEAHPVEEEVAHRSPGCPCCALRLDLVDRLGLVARRRHPPARVVVTHAPGSDVVTAATTVLDDPLLRRHCRLDGILACVPGPVVAAGLLTGTGDGWPTPALLDAVMLADVVWVDDADDLTTEGLVAVVGAIRDVNPVATIETAAMLEPGLLVDLRSWTIQAAGQRASWVGRVQPPGADCTSRTGPAVAHSDRPLHPGRLEDFFRQLHGTTGARLLRLDAVLDVAGDDHRHIALGCRTSLQARRAEPWRPDERRSSKLRVVGRDIDVDDLVDSFQACAV